VFSTFCRSSKNEIIYIKNFPRRVVPYYICNNVLSSDIVFCLFFRNKKKLVYVNRSVNLLPRYDVVVTCLSTRNIAVLRNTTAVIGFAKPNNETRTFRIPRPVRNCVDDVRDFQKCTFRFVISLFRKPIADHADAGKCLGPPWETEVRASPDGRTKRIGLAYVVAQTRRSVVFRPDVT